MYPVLFRIGPFALRSYGLLLALSFFVGILLAGRRIRRIGGDPARIVDLAVVIIVASVIGSRFLYVAFHWQEFAGRPLDVINPFSNPQGVGIAGLSMDGGLVLAVLAGLLFLYLARQPVLDTLDALAPSFALGIFLTRIGCFLNGCCFGMPSSGPLSVVFPEECLAGWVYPHTPLHPAQLYNAMGGLVMLILLLWLERHKTFSGFTFLLALIFYGLLRLLMDFLRYFEESVILFHLGTVRLTVNQGISLVMMLVAVFFFLRLRSRRTLMPGGSSS